MSDVKLLQGKWWKNIFIYFIKTCTYDKFPCSVNNNYSKERLKMMYLIPNTFRTFSKTCQVFILILVCEAIGTAATPGLLWQPRVIVKLIVEK
jgi:hypothetical protein